MPRKATAEERALARAAPIASCTVCRTEKPRSAFQADERKTNGLCSHCCDCRAAANLARWNANLSENLKKKQERRKLNPSKWLEQEAKHRSLHREAINARRRSRTPEQRKKAVAAAAAWRLANPEKAKANTETYRKQWRLNNPEKYRKQAMAAYLRRQARKAGIAYENVCLADIIKRDGPNCYICGVCTNPDAPRFAANRSELEHVVPLAKGGGHTWSNLRCACFRCNRLKGSKFTPEQVRALILGDVAATRPTHSLVLVGA